MNLPKLSTLLSTRDNEKAFKYRIAFIYISLLNTYKITQLKQRISYKYANDTIATTSIWLGSLS